MRAENAVQSWPSGKCPEGVFVEGAEVTALEVAAFVGTLTDTVLVLSAIGLLSQLGVVVPPVPWSVLLGVGVTNGIPEIVVVVLITTAVVLAWKQIETGRQGSRL